MSFLQPSQDFYPHNMSVFLSSEMENYGNLTTGTLTLLEYLWRGLGLTKIERKVVLTTR